MPQGSESTNGNEEMQLSKARQIEGNDQLVLLAIESGVKDRLPSLHRLGRKTGGDRSIKMHFHAGDTHWYIAGYDSDSDSMNEITLYGFVVPYGKYSDAVWRCFNTAEMSRLANESNAVLTEDREWKARPANQIDLYRHVMMLRSVWSRYHIPSLLADGRKP